MSKMRSDRKPPLARSPARLRPRRGLRSSANIPQSPPGSLTKSQVPVRPPDVDELELRPEYRTISCELRALAKKVQDEFGNAGSTNAGFANNAGAISSPLFERGRFYEAYSARRNERLKRKKGETGDERKSAAYDLGVKVESAKRRDSKRLEALKRSVASTPATADRAEKPRYLLRSMTKENKKPPLPSMSCGQKTAASRVPKS
ncbi:uncharacterized protein LOC127808015 [Diospyros lotus]|uniref:uncharacterized protein LOC127808015 n=1 Tax=Diospyros lotus TaxID=55363 RepID=UPI002250A597|nr:uncharacterized protein LOC127808015 [Diospyros lotus]